MFKSFAAHVFQSVYKIIFVVSKNHRVFLNNHDKKLVRKFIYMTKEPKPRQENAFENLVIEKSSLLGQCKIDS